MIEFNFLANCLPVIIAKKLYYSDFILHLFILTFSKAIVLFLKFLFFQAQVDHNFIVLILIILLVITAKNYHLLLFYFFLIYQYHFINLVLTIDYYLENVYFKLVINFYYYSY